MTESKFDLSRLLSTPRLPQIATMPSRFERHEGLSDELGIELWLKREDLIDERGCGHKLRKDAFVAARARSLGSTVLMTAASLPSSQAATIAYVARLARLRSHIVYCGDHQRRPSSLTGNYLLVALFGADVTWHEEGPWRYWSEYLEEAAAAERTKGERPFTISPGFAEWPGLLGSVELGLELAADLSKDMRPVHVIGAAGTGGMMFGIACGLLAGQVTAQVHGACIGPPVSDVSSSIDRLRESARTFLPEQILRHSDVILHGFEAGYGMATPAVLDAARASASMHGLLLDTTYMAKVVACLRRIVDDGAIRRDERVVVIHSGGIASLLGGSDVTDEWVKRSRPEFLIG